MARMTQSVEINRQDARSLASCYNAGMHHTPNIHAFANGYQYDYTVLLLEIDRQLTYWMTHEFTASLEYRLDIVYDLIVLRDHVVASNRYCA